MIFNVPGHIERIRDGLYISACHPYVTGITLVKTETRRPNRGIYQIEAERKKPHYTGYAVQRKRGVPAEPDIRIVMDRIWEESTAEYHREDCMVYPIPISKESAWAEGGYTPVEYEEIYLKLNPKRNRFRRWAFKFHVVATMEFKKIKMMEKATKEENAILRGYGVSEEEITDIEKVGRGEVKVEDYNRKWQK